MSHSPLADTLWETVLGNLMGETWGGGENTLLN